MKRNWIIAIASLLLSHVALASADAPEAGTTAAEIFTAPEPVDSFHFFGRLDNFRPVDRDTLIVWTTAFRPYLIRLDRPSPQLRFAHAIAVTSTAGRVHKGFDEVYVDGWPYRIESIYKLTHEQARNWETSEQAGAWDTTEQPQNRESG